MSDDGPRTEAAPAEACASAKKPALKLFVSYKEGEDESLHMATKFVVPKGWRPGPVSKLLSFCVDTYNGKHKETPLVLEEVHLEVNGLALGLEEVVQDVLKARDEVLIKPGASLALGEAALAALAEATRKADEAEAKRKFAAGKVKCKRHGCGKLFDPTTARVEGECAFHLSPPFVKGGYKGWHCCPSQKPTMDWAEFQAFECCQVGVHSVETPAPFEVPEEAPKPADIDSDEEAEEAAKAKAAADLAAELAAEETYKVEVLAGDDGDFKCRNNGCGVMFWHEENFKGRCKFHRGKAEPGRQEGMMVWSCCPSKEVKPEDLGTVPGCKSGLHWDGSGTTSECEPCKWEF